MNPTTQNEITFSGLGNPEQAIQTPPSQQPVDPITTFTAPTAQETQNLNTAQTGSDQSFEQYSNALFGGSSQEAMTQNAKEQAGFAGLESQLTEIENEIRETSLNFRIERERLQTEPGLTNAQRNARLADISRKQSSQLADLEVRRQSRSNVLFNAESNIQDKVNAQFAEQERNIEGLKFLAERADGKLKTQLDAVAKKEDRAFQIEKDRYTQFENAKMVAIQNASMSGVSNSTLSAIQKSKDMNDLTSKFGRYFTDPKSRAELAKINMEIAGINERNERIKNGEIVLDKDQQSAAFQLQDDYENASKVFKDQVGAYNRIVASAQDPSAAGDLALIFNYMKMLDPGSTVREGEFANAQNAAGLPEQLRAKYNQAINGERLSETTRADFIDRSEKIYNSASSQQKLVDTQFSTRAKQFGVPPEVVVRDLYSVGQDMTQQTRDAANAQNANPWHSPLVPPQPIYNPSNNVWNIPQTQ